MDAEEKPLAVGVWNAHIFQREQERRQAEFDKMLAKQKKEERAWQSPLFGDL